ncbi:LapA family protein [Piscibacillus halophilus]|uniref:Uncharacterized integral membrane protein n=1 Tax=Piscibacillus halophilus TaxID=571933 RepID=A0A1H9BVR3_9BACI|nr:lipopolysaccharide assembly protein LapA domain-containing protein [Piscibacillus halophilus]SEP92653.1 Uncharacterized integral membrane protein [Piscibacillus halophilus]
MKQQSWIVLSLVFALLIAVFAVINIETVEVDFLFVKTNAPLILVILLSVLMGALLIVGFSFSKIYQLQKEVRTLKNENNKLKESQQTKTEVKEPKSKQSKQQDQQNKENHE